MIQETKIRQEDRILPYATEKLNNDNFLVAH